MEAREARFADVDDPIFPSDDGTQLDAHNYRSRVFRRSPIVIASEA